MAVHGCLAPDLIGAYFFKLEVYMAKYKELTSDERGSMIDWYNRGLYSQRELAELFAVSRATVRRVLKEYDEPTLDEMAHPEWEADQPEWPTGPEVGYLYKVGQPTNPEMGQYDFDYDDAVDDTPPAWLAFFVAVGFALWVGGIIYFAL